MPVGDYIHAEDVARAIVSLLQAPRLRYSTYNVACGATSDIRRYGWMGGGKSAGLAPRSCPPKSRHPAGPTLKDGMWVLTMFRDSSGETGWKPRPMRAALHAYMDWMAPSAAPSPSQEPR